ncbi:MAG: patatin-like phospholipase family protein [Burkholderiales bacterium]|nr:patatin-like phospholipase family protein [Burkholderiales bacterium]
MIDEARFAQRACAPAPARRASPATWIGRCLMLSLALLTGCSTVRPWINTPMAQEQAQVSHVNRTRDPSLVMAVTISGGGARAAAFGYGVLRALDEVRFDLNGKHLTLLEATDLISGVSGGSIVSAYYAAFGREGLSNFEPEFLRKNFQQGLISLLTHPGSLHELSSPWFGRSNLLQRQLDVLYRGMTYADVEARPRHPQLIVTATDLTRGNGFEFTWDQFALICSDLGQVPLSFAVAASSSVPIVLSPLTIRNYADQCPAERRAQVTHAAAAGASGVADYRQRLYRAQLNEYLNASKRPYIHLVDGGLADNLGVQRLLDRALMSGGLRQTFREMEVPPGSVRKVVLVVVNAERDPTRNLDLSDRVPGVFDVADALLFGTGARATHETQEFLNDVVRAWHKEVDRRGRSPETDVFAPDAEIHVITVNLRDVSVDRRPRLLQVETAFSIPDAEVTELIAAGRDVLRASPAFQRLTQSLNARIEAADAVPAGPAAERVD